MTRRSLSRRKHGDEWDEAGQHVWEQSPGGQNVGNGSVMRCPPLAIPYATVRDRLAEVSRQSSRITHADPRCTEGCAILNLTVAGLLEDASTPLRDTLDSVDADAPDELVTVLEPVARGAPSSWDVGLRRVFATDGPSGWPSRRDCRGRDRHCGQSWHRDSRRDLKLNFFTSVIEHYWTV